MAFSSHTHVDLRSKPCFVTKILKSRPICYKLYTVVEIETGKSEGIESIWISWSAWDIL